MRCFKILDAEGKLAAFGKNDAIGTEITEAEYNELYAQYCPPFEGDTTAEKAQAWDILTGVLE